MIKVNYLPL